MSKKISIKVGKPLKPKELKTHQPTGKLQNFLIQKIKRSYIINQKSLKIVRPKGFSDVFLKNSLLIPKMD